MEANRRNDQLNMRVSTAEKQEIHARAKRAKKSVVTYVLDLVLGEEFDRGVSSPVAEQKPVQDQLEGDAVKAICHCAETGGHFTKTGDPQAWPHFNSVAKLWYRVEKDGSTTYKPRHLPR